ncbi:hypothetical protein [Rufibacter sp. XAAS-G3-1]|uniref:hypothetical protein n=1 Tax=Rufibacter sp. XAAS-G3-1 TaxID=2729134 RepID=UPI0015E698DE|nr:hypothetical protein [Rufibacter sp. XAAS-G3-1]
MKNNFTPSINIIRDTEKDFFYIPTPNAKRVVGQMVDDFRKGTRAFNLIGSYGTGKSSFLLALEQSLRGVKPYFNAKFLQEPDFEVIKVVGSYNSIIETLAATLQVEAKENLPENVLSEIYNRYHDLGQNGLLFIEIDEFGKLLEYAAQNNPEQELYFVQQLAEFANNPEYNIVLVTTIHQGFESYAYGLTPAQRQEWTKVKGRFREITFNEPVEQLLFLAAEHIDAATNFEAPKVKVKAAYKIFAGTKAFQNTAYSNEISEKIYPLDLFAANVLTLSLQRYGQNERSLFSFLEATDHTSIARFRKTESPFYNLANVYDYLNFNFYSFLTSKYNPDLTAWGAIRTALEQVENSFETNLEAYSRIVKAIGLLSIYASAGSSLNKSFWVAYATLCLGIPEAEVLINDLESKSKQIIRYRNHSKRYILFEGTDVDIEGELMKAADSVNEITDVKTVLEKYLDQDPVLARSYFYWKGTPRYFSYQIRENLDTDVPQGEIDGFINLIFNERLSIDEVQEASKEQKEAILYGYFKNSREIKSLLYEIEKTEKVLQENREDKTAKRELENIVLHQKKLLQHYIDRNLFGEKSEVVWFWNGEKRTIADRKGFVVLLSLICLQVYADTPTFNNELVNKHRISGAIHSAKRNYFKALANHWMQEDLGFPSDKFPAEKTIYITLLKQNGLSPYIDVVGQDISVSEVSSFKALWNCSLNFLNKAKQEKTNLIEFVEELNKRPIKLKQGLIGFWVPTFLFLKRNDLALFGENGYIPILNDEILELISKEPKAFWVKAFDIEGVKLDIFNSYRLFLNQEVKEKVDNQTFIQTIKPFLTFYRDLPAYAKNTKRLSREALAIRTAISKSEDPEKTFFDDFPSALGISFGQLKTDAISLNDYITTLQDAIKEVRTSYDGLVDRVEDFIQDELLYERYSFEEYKSKLQLRYRELKKHMLLPYQKTFIQRLDSVLDDRKAWLNSIGQAVVGKSLENLKDEEEILLYEKFKTLILDLDSLTELSQTEIDEEKEEVLGFQIDSFAAGVTRSILRLPKAKNDEVEVIKKSIAEVLSKDNSLNIAALAKLLKEIVSK